MNTTKIKTVLTVISIILFQLSAFSQSTKWEEVAPGVWKGIVGRMHVDQSATLRHEGKQAFADRLWPWIAKVIVEHHVVS